MWQLLKGGIMNQKKKNQSKNPVKEKQQESRIDGQSKDKDLEAFREDSHGHYLTTKLIYPRL